jgi:2-keto-4-pentenoate hydratase/2-oxohepta-3-ene-1,7-dioic acid hydratase in catechol pathway
MGVGGFGPYRVTGITLSSVDILVSGTSADVGMARTPPLYVKHGDDCKIEIEGIGILSNSVEDKSAERSPRSAE